jgi:hypothetical protein
LLAALHLPYASSKFPPKTKAAIYQHANVRKVSASKTHDIHILATNRIRPQHQLLFIQF